MSREDFDRFRTVALADPTLLARLRDRPADDDDFAGRVVTLGAEQGFAFTRRDVSDALHDAHREWMERWVR
jgi:hypothetical protein